VGNGTIAIASIPVGLLDGLGVLLVGSTRAGFPSQMETLLLQVAANQAAIELQEARRRAELQRASRQLERRVDERTSELTRVNTELRREIAERTRAEDERLMLASLVENSTDFIGVVSLGGQVLFVNPAGRGLAGIGDGEEVLDGRVFDLVVEEDRLRVEEHVWPAVLRTGRWEGELRFRDRTGAPVPMLVHAFVIRDPASDEPVAVAAISRDIAQRKRAEAELLALKDRLGADLVAMTRLHELSTKLQAMTDLHQVLAEILDATILLQEADFGNVQIFDLETRTLEIVAQRGFRAEFLEHFAAVKEESAACGRALMQGQRVIIEDVAIDAAFAPHRAIAARAGFRAVQSTPLFDHGGEPLGMISTHFRQPHRPSEHQLRFTDLYARQASEMIAHHRVEKALQRSETNLAEGERIGHSASWSVNMRSGEIFWSLEHYRIFGLDPASKVTFEVVSMLHHDDRAAASEEWARAMRERTKYEGEFRVVRPDGEVRYCHSIGHPVFDDAGEMVEMVGTLIDTTERTHAEEALARAREELAHVMRVTTMGELTASIAHEVNQPLAAVVTNANACLHWLAAQPANMGEAQAAAQRIIRDANRASDVITHIRSFLTRGKPHHKLLDITEVVREVLVLVQGEAREKGVALLATCTPGLPFVRGDRVQLQQVILNLAINAIEAMSSARGRSRILELGAGHHGEGELRIAVTDTGPGLDAEQRERVFDAFYTTKPHGMGMGLAISRSIIESHGGRLWAARNVKGGETFQFTLPSESAEMSA
jgi:PAS domain S-box-containing protein